MRPLSSLPDMHYKCVAKLKYFPGCLSLYNISVYVIMKTWPVVFFGGRKMDCCGLYCYNDDNLYSDYLVSRRVVCVGRDYYPFGAVDSKRSDNCFQTACGPRLRPGVKHWDHPIVGRVCLYRCRQGRRSAQVMPNRSEIKDRLDEVRRRLCGTLAGVVSETAESSLA